MFVHEGLFECFVSGDVDLEGEQPIATLAKLGHNAGLTSDKFWFVLLRNPLNEVRQRAQESRQDGSGRAHGLFSWQQRQFGEGAHGSQILAAIQNVAGVAWVRLTALSPVGPIHVVPLLLGSARVPPDRRTIACPTDSILALDATDLTLSLAQAEFGKVS